MTMTDRRHDGGRNGLGDNGMNNNGAGPRPRWWRWPLWGGVVAVLAAPAAAMMLDSPGVDWSAGDFAVMGLLLVAAAGAVELAMRAPGPALVRLTASGVVLAALLMTWVNLAVGLLGPGGGWANRLLLLVPLAGLAGAALTLTRTGGANGGDAGRDARRGDGARRSVSRGLTWTMLAMLTVQLAAAALALTEPPTDKGLGWPWQIVAVSGVFGAVWAVAAGAFWRVGKRG
ncbi:MAG: hypothetical protein KF842_13910 [Caulobacter sp.]|nr:hypothetical protein [Caulobacter sp.]